MKPEIILAIGILFFASGFFEKEKVQKISSFVGGLFLAAFGIFALRSQTDGLKNLNFLGGLAFVGLLGWLIFARWSAKTAAASSPTEFHKIKQRAFGFLLAAVVILVLGVVRHTLAESLFGAAVFVFFALWDFLNTRKRLSSKENVTS